MPAQWSTFRELLLPAVAAAPRGRRGHAVEVTLREAVRSGRLRAGTRLPSSRDLAAQLGVARGTVTTAYVQLVAEGYLVAKPGSGTSVAESVDVTDTPTPGRHGPPRRWAYDLRPGLPALGAFPRAAWLAASRAGLAELADSALGYPDPAGLPDLRAELTGYLGRVRAVASRSNQVVITHGAAEGLTLLAGVLSARGHRCIAVEAPGHPEQAKLLAVHGLVPHPVPVDDRGIRVDLLDRAGCAAVLVTAAHQFPLGVVLHPDRRHALLAWARAHEGIVIEDDYDAEHRYDRPALGAMQALDPRRVIYQGSVSKTLAPALRLGWLVVPPALVDDVVQRKLFNDLGCSPLPQAALAQLLRTGGYDRHLRRTRAQYRQRRDALLTALAERLPGWRPFGVAAGLHMVVRLPEGTDDVDVQRRLAERGVNAPALSNYARNPADPPFPGLVLGYAALSADRLCAAVRVIADCIEQTSSAPHGAN